jgi:hypothetical protein
MDECRQDAVEISQAASMYQLDPVLLVAINVQECDMRKDVAVPIVAEAGKHKVRLGVDACPMGVRIMGYFDRDIWSPESLYIVSAKRLAHWREWCLAHKKKHDPAHVHHHFVAHYNEGNPVYSAQVLAFYATLLGKKAKNEVLLTERTKEIRWRLNKAFGRKS